MLGAAVLSADMFASPLGARLMQTYNPWVPIFVGLGLCLPALPLAFVLPETLTAAKVPGDVPSDLRDESPMESAGKGILGHVNDGILRLKTAAVFFIWGNKTVAALLLTLLTSTLGKGAQELIMQFARKKYGWSWAQVRPRIL